MTNFQSNSAGLVAYKRQASRGAQESGTGATVLRTAGGAGIKASKAAIESNEVRRDGMRSRGRHGTQKSVSDYIAEMSLGSHDSIIEDVVRGTWDSGALSAAAADYTTVTTGANSIVSTNGSFSWITKGFRAGDVIRGATFPDAANNGKNLRLVAVTASTLTTAETLIVNATPSALPVISRPGKRLINPAAGSLVRRYNTLEEYELDIDQSTVLTDFRWGSIKFSMGTNGLLMADPGGVGTGQVAALATGASPLFTSPTESIAAPMSVVDATIRVNGIDQVALTSLDVTMDIGLSAPDVFGSGAIRYSPDVFDGQMALTINLGMLRPDLALFSDFLAETQYTLHILGVENESEPKDFIALEISNFTLGGVDPSALSKQGGGRTQTVSIPPALVGKDVAGGAFDPTMIRFQTTAS